MSQVIPHVQREVTRASEYLYCLFDF
jgi:hypothetical protein